MPLIYYFAHSPHSTPAGQFVWVDVSDAPEDLTAENYRGKWLINGEKEIELAAPTIGRVPYLMPLPAGVTAAGILGMQAARAAAGLTGPSTIAESIAMFGADRLAWVPGLLDRALGLYIIDCARRASVELPTTCPTCNGSGVV